MFRVIENLLTAAELQQLQSAVPALDYEDGAATAGAAARPVKRNLQAVMSHPVAEGARGIVGTALARNEAFRDFALPHRVVPPIFSRYEVGMRYGAHTDNAVMTGVRTDLALTLFLSDPESYDGGELVFGVDRDPRRIKLPAGTAVAYSAATLHQVEEVTRGVRFAAITWIQSLVPDAARREILEDLIHVLRQLRGNGPSTPQTLLLAKSRANLLRMWADV